MSFHLTAGRVNSALWVGHPSDRRSLVESREEASCSRPKVRFHLARFCLLLTMHREFQLFLVGYIIVEICEIFTVGGFPLERKVRLVRLCSLPAVWLSYADRCRALLLFISVRSLQLYGFCC